MAVIARSSEVFDSVAESRRERVRFANGSEVDFLPSTGAPECYREWVRYLALD